MRLKWITVLAIGFLAAQASAGEAPVLKTQKDKVSYGIGVDVARNFKRLGIDLDVEVLIKALRDVYSGEKLLMTEEDLRKTMNAHQTELREKQVLATRKVAEDNKKQGGAFLAENKTKEGVVTLPSGLQYKVLMEGSGKIPKTTDEVTVNYRGTFIDGTEFDSSYTRGKPATFRVDSVIRGWTEALLLMKEGSKWQFFIPPDLGYGERGAGPIPPNSTLIFEVELISVK